MTTDTGRGRALEVEGGASRSWRSQKQPPSEPPEGAALPTPRAQRRQARVGLLSSRTVDNKRLWL